MAIYAISDLHLSFGINEKPMNVFGSHWDNHVEKIEKNWKELIKDDDIVLMAGDFSWATYLEESLEDFKFLESLPGQKIMIKGNHDYWWSTLKKMNSFLANNNIKSVKLIHNNAVEIDNFVVAGTRYWDDEEETNDEKIFNRECERAKISLKMAQDLNPSKPIIFMTHFPPDERIIEAVKNFPIKYWIYGHIHSNYDEKIVTIPEIDSFLTSCDYLNFHPYKISE